MRNAEVPILPMVVDRILNPSDKDDEDGRLAADGRLVGHALRRLVAEDLQGLSEEVQGVSARLEQVAELNRAMAVNVNQQVEQLERLYGESVAQAENFRRGNVQLKKAVERTAGSSNYLVVLILVAALGLLFLDRMT
mgnify:CR=1 FL=1